MTKPKKYPKTLYMNLTIAIAKQLEGKNTITVADLLANEGIDLSSVEYPEHNRLAAEAAYKIMGELGWRAGEIGYPREPGFIRVSVR